VLCRGDRVIGYYTLAMSSVGHAGAPGRLRRRVPDPVPVALLARLALDSGERRPGLGGELLIDALRRYVRGGREFGARAVVVDAIDTDAPPLRLQGARRSDEWRRVSDIDRALGG